MGDVEWQNTSDFPQSLPSLFFFFFFSTPRYWSSMKGKGRAHLQLNLILHRQKSKIVHVKKDRKELFVGDQNFFTLCYWRIEFCWCNPCKPQWQSQQLYLRFKTNKRTTKSIRDETFVLKLKYARYLVEVKKKKETPSACCFLNTTIVIVLHCFKDYIFICKKIYMHHKQKGFCKKKKLF